MAKLLLLTKLQFNFHLLSTQSSGQPDDPHVPHNSPDEYAAGEELFDKS